MAFFDRFFRRNTGLAEGASSKPPETPLTRFFDNLRVRMVLTGGLSVLFLVNLVLAATAFHVSPSGVDGALAWQIVLVGAPQPHRPQLGGS